MGAEDLDSGPRIYTGSALPTETPPQSLIPTTLKPFQTSLGVSSSLFLLSASF